MPLSKTRNDLPVSVRREMVELSNARLADAIDLSLQVKQAHWNVTGKDFIQLHELFDKLYAEAQEYVDLIAERAVQLGGTAEGTLQAVVERTGLSPYPLNLSGGTPHLTRVAEAMAAFGKSIRTAIEAADEAGDSDTADIFTEISRGTDKGLWFVEAHLR